jgi:hypothetical protein
MLDVNIVSANDGIIWLIFHGELIWQVIWSYEGGSGRNQSMSVYYLQFSAELC